MEKHWAVPEAGILNALRYQPLSWRECLGELIDNAIDAEATQLTISGTSQALNVHDNGVGCLDPSVMIRLGSHQEYSSTQSGLFGMGGKTVALWLWGQTDIVTKSAADGAVRGLRVRWDDITHWSDFKAPVVIKGAGARKFDGDHGTSITYNPSSNRHIHTIAQAQTRDWLQWVFRPALQQGRVIRIAYGGKAFELKPPPFPTLVEKIECEGSIGGKEFRLTAGIIDQSESVSRSGFHLVRGPRVIETTNEPANGFDASRFFAWVELDRTHWTPALNKNKLTDVDRDDLFDKLRELCEPLLKEAETWAEMVGNEAIEQEVSEALRYAHSAAYGVELHIKAKRHSPEHETGAVKPQKTTKTHKRTQRAQDGDKTMATPREHSHGRGILFKLNPLDDRQFYKCERQQKKLTVTFNNRLALVKALALERGKNALKGMAMAAAGVYEATHTAEQAAIGANIAEDCLNRVWLGWHDQFIAEAEPAVAS
jgi:hypothetical protein